MDLPTFHFFIVSVNIYFIHLQFHFSFSIVCVNIFYPANLKQQQHKQQSQHLNYGKECGEKSIPREQPNQNKE